MININLVPYREAEKKKKANIFVASFVGALAIVGAACYVLYLHFDDQVKEANSEIAYLNSVKADLDKKISSIADLKKKKDELIKRENIIVVLQNERNLQVHIFNNLPISVPNGIYLSKMQQQGNLLILKGYASSNDVVAQLMRNLDAVPMLKDATLSIIQKVKIGDQEAKSFQLQVTINDSPKVKKSSEKFEKGVAK